MSKPIQIKNTEKSEPGFTLIEVLIAIVILSIGLLGMASLTAGIIKGNKFSNDVTTATTLAQDKMEDVRRAGRTNYASVSSETKAVLPSPYDQYKLEVTTTDGVPASGMKKVLIEVFWGGAAKENHSVELETILAQ